MRAEEIRKYAKAEPFKPFAIRLEDGREFIVSRPQSIWVPPSGLNCVVGEDDGTAVLLSVEQVASISYRDAA